MWFERPSASRQLFYHLRLTARRNNIQLLLSQLDRRAKVGDFYVVIHDGRKDAFFIPYSWLQTRILSRKPAVRHRPANPAQRYYTVYPVEGSSTVFSFGPDPRKNTVKENLRQFRNSVRSEVEARRLLEATSVRSWEDTEGGIVALDSRSIPRSLRKELPRRGNSERNEGLAGEGGVVVVTKDGKVLAIHKERKSDPAKVVRLYEEMLAKGKVSGKLTITRARARPFQRALRLVALDVYKSRCAMCDVEVPSQLVTSHILPVRLGAFARSRALPSNTLLLCRLHDGLFDKHLITVRPSYRIACSPRLKTKSRLLTRWALRLQGMRIALPARHRPDKQLLREHMRAAGVR